MTTPVNAVVVGYDGSPDSKRGVAWAVAAARRRQRLLHVVIAKGSVTPHMSTRRQSGEDPAAGLEADARGLVGAGIASMVTTQVADGPASHVLLEAAKHASMVVIGSRGHARLSGMLIGSVSQHLARHAACPVVVVRQPHDPDAKRVVVGVDGSEGADKALAFACDHASHWGAPLTAMYAWWRSLPSAGDSALTYDIVTVQQEIDTGRRALAESLAGWQERYPDLEVTAEAIPLPPAHALTDASAHAALVVVGSRGRGAFQSLLLGSTSQSVLHHAQCTVAIAR